VFDIFSVFEFVKEMSFLSLLFGVIIMKGESRESRSKLAVLGKASLNLAELASKMETRFERKLPMTLHDGRFAREATLSVR
jgi:hypothetical protein